ncbi:hypothetical protein [Methylorubrum sp. SB2]|uniref:hypothetical protein n=1 Tax=Methylorubrum subtropicum TaxID=3138812 RepID=UPI00313DAF2E
MSESSESVAITIFGRHVANWMRALDENAPVWTKLSGVRSVRVLERSSPGFDLPPDPAQGRPVLIPLLEPHIRSRPPGYFTLCPSREALDTLADKRAFAAYVRRQGLDALAPAVYDTVEEARFPCLAKPIARNGGQGIRLLHDREAYEAFSASPAWAAHPHILQAFLAEEQDYSTYLFCRAGRIAWHRTFRYVVAPEAPIRGPVSYPASEVRTLCDAHLADLERFLIPLAHDGPCNVDHKILPDGTLQVLEINPRLGGSLIMPDYLDDLAANLALVIAHARFEPV